jgi:hypothetical protein
MGQGSGATLEGGVAVEVSGAYFGQRKRRKPKWLRLISLSISIITVGVGAKGTRGESLFLEWNQRVEGKMSSFAPLTRIWRRDEFGIEMGGEEDGPDGYPKCAVLERKGRR